MFPTRGTNFLPGEPFLLISCKSMMWLCYNCFSPSSSPKIFPNGTFLIWERNTVVAIETEDWTCQILVRSVWTAVSFIQIFRIFISILFLGEDAKTRLKKACPGTGWCGIDAFGVGNGGGCLPSVGTYVGACLFSCSSWGSGTLETTLWL